MTHALKTVQPCFDEVMSGDKMFDLRINDRPFKVGDVIILQEYSIEEGYSGAELTFTIGYILRDAYQLGLRTDYCILGLKGKTDPY